MLSRATRQERRHQTGVCAVGAQGESPRKRCSPGHTPHTRKELNSPSKGSEKSISSGGGGESLHISTVSVACFFLGQDCPCFESWQYECQQLGLEPKHQNTKAPPAIACPAVSLAKCGYDPCHKSVSRVEFKLTTPEIPNRQTEKTPGDSLPLEQHCVLVFLTP